MEQDEPILCNGCRPPRPMIVKEKIRDGVKCRSEYCPQCGENYWHELAPLFGYDESGKARTGP